MGLMKDADRYYEMFRLEALLDRLTDDPMTSKNDIAKVVKLSNRIAGNENWVKWQPADYVYLRGLYKKYEIFDGE